MGEITSIEKGLAEMRGLITEFLNRGEGTPPVREYISSVIENDAVLLIYLNGRKYKARHAFETLKRKAEVRFNEYPDAFPEVVPDFTYSLLKEGKFGLLKARDNLGRRLFFLNGGKWDPSELSLDQISMAGTHHFDRLLWDEDVMNNGLIMIQNCEGMGMKHAKEYTLQAMLKQLNLFYLAYPLKIKAFYYINVPSYARYLYTMMKPFLSKKLKERPKKFQVLHEVVSPKFLPKSLGGVLEIEEAFDFGPFMPMK